MVALGLNVKAAKIELEFIKGDHFERTWTLTDENDAVVDLTGYTGEFIAKREKYDSANLLEANDTNGYFMVGDTDNGVFTISIPAVVTDALDLDNEDFIDTFFQIRLIDSAAKPVTIFYGNLRIRNDV